MAFPNIAPDAEITTVEAARWVGVPVRSLAMKLKRGKLITPVQHRIVAKGKSRTTAAFYRWSELKPILEELYGDTRE